MEDHHMIFFIEKTWFLWWLFAAVVIVRWSLTFLADNEADPLDATRSGEADAPISSGPLPSGKVSRLFF